jgi:SAM-dependent methyltransferase
MTRTTSPRAGWLDARLKVIPARDPHDCPNQPDSAMRLTGPVQRLASTLNRGRYERVMRLLTVTPRDRILELGCGDGRRSIARYNATNEIVGIDLMPPARLRFERPNFRYEQGDASDLARFPDGAFDVAVSFGMLEHVHPEARIRAVISETRRVAGRYCFIVPHRYAFIEPHFLLPLFALWPDRLKSALIRRFDVGTQRRSPSGRWQRINWLTEREWREQFDDPDVRILDHWYGPLLLDYLIVGEGESTRASAADGPVFGQDQPLADDRLRP